VWYFEGALRYAKCFLLLSWSKIGAVEGGVELLRFVGRVI
jgi:hypothetical protein